MPSSSREEPTVRKTLTDVLDANLSHFALLHEGQYFQEGRDNWPQVPQTVCWRGQDHDRDVEARQILLKRQVPISGDKSFKVAGSQG